MDILPLKYIKDSNRQVYIPFALLFGGIGGIVLSLIISSPPILGYSISLICCYFFIEWSYDKSLLKMALRYQKSKKKSLLIKKKELGMFIIHCLRMDSPKTYEDFLQKLPKAFSKNPKLIASFFEYLPDETLVSYLPYWQEMVDDVFILYSKADSASIYELENLYDAPIKCSGSGLISRFKKLLDDPEMIIACKHLEFTHFVDSGKIFH